MNQEPKSLQEAIVYFSNPDNCIDYVAIRRWPNGKVICPGCGSEKVSQFNAKRRTWKCGSHHPKREFSIKIGTIYEDSPIPLDKWLTATWMLTNCKNGVSSYEIAKDVRVTQKSAWFMLQRIRLAMKNGSVLKLGGTGGPVEVDETFIGGKARFMHSDKRAEKIHGRGPDGKAIVAAVFERGGTVRAKVCSTRRKPELQELVRENVEAGSNVYSDALKSYDGLDEFQHQVVDHAIEYVNGNVHTNGLENFWSLLKRSLKGTYVSVEPFHLFRYLDEQSFRFNNRDMTDLDRFVFVMRCIVGRRLTYKQLTGKVEVAHEG